MMSAHVLLVENLASFDPDVMVFDYDEVYREQNQFPDPHVLDLAFEEQELKVILYNSLTYKRTGKLVGLSSKAFFLDVQHPTTVFVRTNFFVQPKTVSWLAYNVALNMVVGFAIDIAL